MVPSYVCEKMMITKLVYIANVKEKRDKNYEY